MHICGSRLLASADVGGGGEALIQAARVVDLGASPQSLFHLADACFDGLKFVCLRIDLLFPAFEVGTFP